MKNIAILITIFIIKSPIHLNMYLNNIILNKYVIIIIEYYIF